ncbi:hypothetical protein [Burkholderia cenocepacia]|uniref:hypothetical protein n=1 Tax=Burkholderia cenocepacia TaxID=95486 RepID=UPI0026569D8D|nr:hypothetical protein [Burkholderia cenocepacia]MDN7664056.1 hypothetical protein [Burkholderia cenocepacia]
MNEMKRFWFQLTIGGWLGMGAFAGIVGRSWGSFGVFAAIAAYFFAIGAGREAGRSTRPPVRIAGNVVWAACALLFVGAALLAVERLYLVNGGSYPSFLAHDLGAASYSTLEKLRLNECKGEGMEVYRKGDDRYVIRCGFSWIEGHTYISTANPYADVLKGLNTDKGGK